MTAPDLFATEHARREAEEATAKPDPHAWIDDVIVPIREHDANYFAKPPPPREYLLHFVEDGEAKGVLAAGRVGFLVSPGGVGKSHALCSLALAVAIADRKNRTTWLGSLDPKNDDEKAGGFLTVNHGKAGRVLMLMGEEEADEIHRRLYQAAAVMQLDAHDTKRALARIYAVPLAGRSDLAFTKATTSEGEKAETAFFQSLRDRLQGDEGWSLVILDPLSRFSGADDEVDNAAATRLVSVIEQLSDLPGKPTVMVAHHTRKRDAKSPTSTVSDDDMRGASALRDGARFVAVLETQKRIKGAPDLVNFAVRKNNYGAHVDVMLSRQPHGTLCRATRDERRRYDEAVAEAADDEKPPARRAKLDRGTAATTLHETDPDA